MVERLVDVTFQGRIPEKEAADILTQHPGLRLVHESQLSVQEEIMSWQDELTQLRTLVARSKELLEANDPEVENAYTAYWKLLRSKSTSSDRLTMPDRETSIEGIFQLFDASIDGYVKRFPECGLTETGAYRKLDNRRLNPRQIRFVIFSHGLAKEKRTLGELRQQENYKGVGSVTDAIDKADNLVLWHLAGVHGDLIAAKPRSLRTR